MDIANAQDWQMDSSNYQLAKFFSPKLSKVFGFLSRAEVTRAESSPVLPCELLVMILIFDKHIPFHQVNYPGSKIFIRTKPGFQKIKLIPRTMIKKNLFNQTNKKCI